MKERTRIFAVTKAVTGKVVLVVSSIVVTLLLMEISIRLFFPQPINYYNFTLIQADGGAEMVTGSDITVRGKRPKGYGPYIPNLSARLGEVLVTINSHGWRDTEYSFEKPQGATRILVIGDSVTFGYGVELEDMFPKVLERELNRQGRGRYEVINLGGAGANTYYQRNAIKENVPIYRPDIVILAFNLNDILPRIFGKENMSSSDGWRSISRIILRVRKKLDAAFRSRSHLYFLFREGMKHVLRKFGIASPTMVRLPAFDIESDYGMAAWRETRGVLLQIAAQLQEYRIPLLLLILPVEMQISETIADIYRREYGFVFGDDLVKGKPQHIIAAFAEQYGIAYLDVLSAFRNRPEEKTFFRIYGRSVDYDHPNPLGHQIIAEELKRSLSSLALLPNSDDRSGRRALYNYRQLKP